MMADAPIITVKTLEEVALLSYELLKLGARFDVRSNGREWVFELTGF